MKYTCTRTKKGTFIFYKDGKRIRKNLVPSDIRDKCEKKPDKDLYVAPLKSGGSRVDKLTWFRANCSNMKVTEIRAKVAELKLGVKAARKTDLCNLVKLVIKHELNSSKKTGPKKASEVKLEKQKQPYSFALISKEGTGHVIYLTDASDQTIVAKVRKGKVEYEDKDVEKILKKIYKEWKKLDEPYIVLFKITKDAELKNVHGVSMFTVPFKRKLPSVARSKLGTKKPSPRLSYSVVLSLGGEDGKKKLVSANITYDEKAKTFGEPTKLVNESVAEDGEAIKHLKRSLKKWRDVKEPDEMYIENSTGKIIYSR